MVSSTFFIGDQKKINKRDNSVAEVRVSINTGDEVRYLTLPCCEGYNCNNLAQSTVIWSQLQSTVADDTRSCSLYPDCPLIFNEESRASKRPSPLSFTIKSSFANAS